jgi:translation initiation factor IF-3
MQHPEIARDLLKNIMDSASDIAKPDRTPAIKQEGKIFSLHLAPLLSAKKGS